MIRLRENNGSVLVVISAIALVVALISGILITVVPFGFVVVFVLPFYMLLLFNNVYDTSAFGRYLTYLLPLYIVLSIVWPHYLSLNFGGPDITPARIVLLVMLIIWFVALISKSYRHELVHNFRQSKLFYTMLFVYLILRLFSAILSSFPVESLYRYANELLSVIVVSFIAITAIRTKHDLKRLLLLLLICTGWLVIVSTLEIVYSSNPITWFIPPGFHFSNEYVNLALDPKFRSGSYRVQSVFLHPLLFVEFAAFVIPLIIGNAILLKSRVVYVLSGIIILLLMVALLHSGSRSALVSIFISTVFLLVFYIMYEVHERRFHNLIISVAFGVPAVLLLILFVLMYFSVDMSIITGRTVDEINSTAARMQMYEMGADRIAAHPLIGYGVGLAAAALGYVTNGGFVTIDSYYLSLALESGLLVLMLFFSIVIQAVYTGIFDNIKDGQIKLIGLLLAVSLIGMVVVKSISSLIDNLMLFFVVMIIINRLRYIDINESEAIK